MKTYTKQTTETKNRLVIEHDEDAESPRKNCDNLGYFITVDRNYRSPDGNGMAIYTIVKETGGEAGSQAEHKVLISKRIQEETDEKVIAIYPIVKYKHSSVFYSLGTKKGFDYSNNGFYIITDKTQKLLGTPEESFEKVITQELDEYNKWVNGEVYQFMLYDKDGEHEDSCSGFYGIEDIKQYLPDEWKDEDLSKYII